MSQLKQHPLSAAFPAMSADDFSALVEDIKVNGQREPVIVFEGMVLDGWHRYTACVQAGIEPQKFTFDASKDPVAFVLSQNLHRRHLSASQRAAAVVACTEWAPASRPKKVEPSSTFSKNNELAKAAGVTPRTITDAKTAHKAGLTDAVKDGAMTVKEAAQIARGKQAKEPKRTLEAPAPDGVEALTDADNLREAQDTLAEIVRENETLRDRLAIESMDVSEDEKTQAAETIRELRALVKTLEAENDAIKVSRDTYMRENSELKKSVNYWRKQAEKAAKDAAA